LIYHLETIMIKRLLERQRAALSAFRNPELLAAGATLIALSERMAHTGEFALVGGRCVGFGTEPVFSFPTFKERQDIRRSLGYIGGGGGL